MPIWMVYVLPHTALNSAVALKYDVEQSASSLHAIAGPVGQPLPA